MSDLATKTTAATGATEAPSGPLSDLASRINALEQRHRRTDFEAWTAVLTLFALAIYGAARFGDTAFYARLGTDPDTVGMNYGVTLARVATTVAVAGAALLTLFLFGRLDAKPQNERPNLGPWAKAFFGLAQVVAFALSALLLLLIITPALIPIVEVRWILALVFSVALILAGNRYEKARLNNRSLEPIRLIIAAAMAIVILFGLAAITGYHSAGYIMRGQPLPCPCVSLLGHNITLPWSSGTNGFLGIKAEKASVKWIGPGKRTVPESAVFLGASNESVVLFDIAAQTTLVVPVSNVIVRHIGNLTGWNER